MFITQFAVGDRVAFSRRFLRSTGQFTGAIPFARGTVAEIQPLSDKEFAIVTVIWDQNSEPDSVPAKILDINLVLEKDLALEAS